MRNRVGAEQRSKQKMPPPLSHRLIDVQAALAVQMPDKVVAPLDDRRLKLGKKRPDVPPPVGDLDVFDLSVSVSRENVLQSGLFVGVGRCDEKIDRQRRLVQTAEKFVGDLRVKNVEMERDPQRKRTARNGRHQADAVMR